MSLILGIESCCDETAAALVDQRPAHPRAIAWPARRAAHRPYGGVVPEIAARAHVEILPRLIEEVLARGRDRAGRGRRDRRDRRAGPDRRGHGRAGRRPRGSPWPRASRWSRSTISKAMRLSPMLTRSRPRFPLSAAARLGRPLPIAARRRGRPLSPARHDDRRCRRRGVRQEREAARPRLSRRPGGRARRGCRAIRARCRCRGRCSARPSPISPSPGSRARCCAPATAAAIAPSDIAASFQQAVVDCLVDRTARAIGARGGRDRAGRRRRRRRQPGDPRPR